MIVEYFYSILIITTCNMDKSKNKNVLIKFTHSLLGEKRDSNP